MRVCHFSSSTLETHYFANLGKGLSARGVFVLWGTLLEERPPAWIEELPAADYFCLNAPSRFHYPLAVLRLARLLRKERIDVLQTHLFDAGIIGVVAAKLAGRTVIVTRHHMDQVGLIGTRFHVALDRWMARKADHVVVLSNAVRDYMVSSDSVDGDKIEVIHQGFDFENFSATEEDRKRVRAEFTFTSEFVVGCIGNLFKTKGHIYLLTALRELIEEVPNVKLLLVGSGDKTYVEEIVSNLQLEERVVFAGFRRDVPACMRAMDLVVHPSLSEAFCQVLIETMSVGTPLITTDVGGATEVVTHGETGMVVPPADTDAIADTVLRLYRNPELRRHIAAAGQRSVRLRFPVERMVEKQIECYRRLLKGSASSEKVHVGSQI